MIDRLPLLLDLRLLFVDGVDQHDALNSKSSTYPTETRLVYSSAQCVIALASHFTSHFFSHTSAVGLDAQTSFRNASTSDRSSTISVR